jgi:hypothetical protein
MLRAHEIGPPESVSDFLSECAGSWFLVVEYRMRRWVYLNGAQTMLMRVFSRAAIGVFAIFAVALPAHGLTSEEAVAKIEAAGYSHIREMTAGKIMTYRAVRAGKEVSLVVDSFGKVKELP